jgi:hypothetical protein
VCCHFPFCALQVRFTMRYTGNEPHPDAHQEVPAVFVHRRLNVLALYTGEQPWSNGDLTFVLPGQVGEYYRPTERWAAYVDQESGFGLGVYTPVASQLVAYRIGPEKSNARNDVSYMAPLVTANIQPNTEFSYDAYIAVGRVDEMRGWFAEIASKVAPTNEAGSYRRPIPATLTQRPLQDTTRSSDSARVPLSSVSMLVEPKGDTAPAKKASTPADKKEQVHKAQNPAAAAAAAAKPVATAAAGAAKRQAKPPANARLGRVSREAGHAQASIGATSLEQYSERWSRPTIPQRPAAAAAHAAKIMAVPDMAAAPQQPAVQPLQQQPQPVQKPQLQQPGPQQVQQSAPQQQMQLVMRPTIPVAALQSGPDVAGRGLARIDPVQAVHTVTAHPGNHPTVQIDGFREQPAVPVQHGAAGLAAPTAPAVAGQQEPLNKQQEQPHQQAPQQQEQPKQQQEQLPAPQKEQLPEQQQQQLQRPLQQDPAQHQQQQGEPRRGSKQEPLRQHQQQREPLKPREEQHEAEEEFQYVEVDAEEAEDGEGDINAAAEAWEDSEAGADERQQELQVLQQQLQLMRRQQQLQEEEEEEEYAVQMHSVGDLDSQPVKQQQLQQEEEEEEWVPQMARRHHAVMHPQQAGGAHSSEEPSMPLKHTPEPKHEPQQAAKPEVKARHTQHKHSHEDAAPHKKPHSADKHAEKRATRTSQANALAARRAAQVKIGAFAAQVKTANSHDADHSRDSTMSTMSAAELRARAIALARADPHDPEVRQAVARLHRAQASRDADEHLAKTLSARQVSKQARGEGRRAKTSDSKPGKEARLMTKQQHGSDDKVQQEMQSLRAQIAKHQRRMTRIQQHRAAKQQAKAQALHDSQKPGKGLVSVSAASGTPRKVSVWRRLSNTLQRVIEVTTQALQPQGPGAVASTAAVAPKTLPKCSDKSDVASICL